MTGTAFAPEVDQRARENANLAILAGPLVELIQRPSTLDVCVNPNKKIWVNTLGSGWSCVGEFFDSRIFLQGVASMRDITLNRESPILETTFPITGDRLTGVIGPVAEDGPVIALRSRQKNRMTLADLRDSGVLTRKGDPLNALRHRDEFPALAAAASDHLEVLHLAAKYRRNVLMVGPTGAGKTTLGNICMDEWDAVTPNDRVVIIEDTPELQCPLENSIQLVSTAKMSQADVLKTSLRLIPKRLVVGEVRDEEAAAVLLQAFNSGHSGGLVTIHADDALSGLRKLEMLLGEHTVTVRERIAGAIHVVVFIDLEGKVSAGRKVREVLLVHGINKRTGDYSVDYL